MCDLIRLVTGSSPEVVDLRRPFSNFQYLQNRHGDWHATHGLSRIFSQARRSMANTLVVELLPPKNEIADEVRELTSLASDYVDGGAWRLSFFRTPFSVSSDISRLPSNDLAGYAIVRKDCFGENCTSHVFESVFSKYDHIHNFVPGLTEYFVDCNGRRFSVHGIMYCQQNAANKACAQVALRSLLSSIFPNQPINYSILNSQAQVTEPGKGLTSVQIRRILDQFGVPYVDLDYDTDLGRSLVESVPYHRFIYTGMESGRGGLVGFEFSKDSDLDQTVPEPRPRHIIPFFGHTFNQDTWAPRASGAYFHVGQKTRYIPSDEWMSSFIGHDDNFGPNFCIPRKFIAPQQVKYVLSLLPAKLIGTPLSAEARAIDFLYNHLDQIDTNAKWGRRWKTHIQQQDTVARTLLMSRERYHAHLTHATDWEGHQENTKIASFLCNEILPEDFWMVELSLPDLYSANYSKIGELLFTLQPEGLRIDLAILRISEQYAIKLPSRSDLVSIPSCLKSHVPLYTHEVGLLDFQKTWTFSPTA